MKKPLQLLSRAIARRGIAARLAIGFGLVLALLAVIMAVSLFTMAGMQRRIDTILQTQYRQVGAASEIKYNVARIHQLLRSAILAAEYQGENRVLADIVPLRKRNAEILAQLESGLAGTPDADRPALIAKAGMADEASQKELFALLNQGMLGEARNLLNGSVRLSSQEYVKALSDLVELQSARMASESDASRAAHGAALRNILVLGVSAMLAGALAAAVIVRGLLRQLGGEPGQASAIAARIAGGDLAGEIALRRGDQDSLMSALAAMRERLAQLVGQVRGGAEKMSAISHEIADGNHDLSARTEHQAGALEETASSMEELTATVGQNAASAQQANQLVMRASAIATEGGAVVGQVVDTMRGISLASNRISDIIGVIDSIAFQTNILALNAAVEAARAGEQGRGFAVVASEVRSLAHRSASAAKEIKALIGDSAARVTQGSALVDRAGATMEQIVDSVGRVRAIMGEIMEAGAEQSAGIAQVNRAIADMDGMTQQNAALVEQAAAATGSMRDESAALAELVNRFKLPATATPQRLLSKTAV
ncbi:MAG: methyl-accepting chemotaxis protein [Pseudomonadota bacterium]